MECIEAQSLISAGMDREPVSAASLAQAKEHCRTCPQCSAFVSTQLAARQAALPQPPADLHERTMTRIRAEAETMAADAAATAASQQVSEATEPASDPSASAAPTREIRVPAFITPTLAPKPPKERSRGRGWPSIAVAAGVVVALVGTGLVVTFGMRLISSMGSETDRGAYTFDGKVSSGAPEAAPAQTQDGRAPGPNAITIKGMVYVQGESSDADSSTLTPVGTFSSGLDGDSASTRTAYRDADDSMKIIVADNAGMLWEFAPVTRDYLGDTYVLVSKELARFGQWPALPKSMEAPADDQGGTTFAKRGTDSTGARVFIPSAPFTGYGSEVVIPGVSSAPSMIALAPRSAGSILADDPNWTLWLQLP
jgi:hypothetical protein